VAVENLRNFVWLNAVTADLDLEIGAPKKGDLTIR